MKNILTMKFALINGKKTEPIKGVKGHCPNCNSVMIAKCGTKKLHHWVHKGNLNCDVWWENETEWHREWKNYFPTEWQEVILFDKQTNEKHIADIKTENGLVIEFQHSHIHPNERYKREEFYKNLVWIVDGTRLKKDFPRFISGFENNFIKSSQKEIYNVRFFEDYFPKFWIESSVPVVFDFKGSQVLNHKDIRNDLFCLFPTKNCRNGKLARFSKLAFIKSVKTGEWSERVKIFLDNKTRKNR